MKKKMKRHNKKQAPFRISNARCDTAFEKWVALQRELGTLYTDVAGNLYIIACQELARVGKGKKQ